MYNVVKGSIKGLITSLVITIGFLHIHKMYVLFFPSSSGKFMCAFSDMHIGKSNIRKDILWQKATNEMNHIAVAYIYNEGLFLSFEKLPDRNLNKFMNTSFPKFY